MTSTVRWLAIAVLAGTLLFLPIEALAQQTGLGSQSLRGYTHVFIAYGVAWLLILGWLVSVFRRMGRLDRELNGG